MNKIEDFIQESLWIEGIQRSPTLEEIKASREFLNLPYIGIQQLCCLQEVLSPNSPLREKLGMDVQIGNDTPPKGGMALVGSLGNLLFRISNGGDPFLMHKEFERIHPFMDGNGRTGRVLWAWNMNKTMQDPFLMPFLKRWYFQSLGSCGHS